MHEEKNVFARLQATYATSRKQAQSLLQNAGGLSIVEWRTLWDLAEAGPLTIRELAETQRTDHSQLSRALPEMRRKGYVSMHRDAEDGRQIIVTPTDAGRAAFDLASPSMRQRRAALRAQFTPEELDEFIAYIDRLDAFLRLPIDEILGVEELNE